MCPGPPRDLPGTYTGPPRDHPLNERAAVKLKSAVLLNALVGPSKGHVLSGRKLAAAVGVHRSFIDHLTSGRRSGCTDEVAAALSEALGVPTGVLFHEDESPSERAHAA